ncbi:MAG TPA: ABC transporter permease [Pseudomonadales bacterium]|nr:ABC transporter permease [Pseudomonadales bacterium]
MTILKLAAQSAWNRRLTLSMTLISIALSITLLLGVERLRQDARSGFEQSISGADLIIGARTSPVQLMLYAVFRLGGATNNIGWASFKKLQEQPAVAWAVPLSLGDSHRGYPVLATDASYFEYFHYGENRALELTQGKIISGTFDVVIGAEVADKLNYQLGDRVVLTHGMAQAGPAHDDKPFAVTGILARTGTPVDRTLHITLAGMEAIHLNWAGGAPLTGLNIPAEYIRKFDLTPKTITAVLVGLKNRAAVFKMQRFVSEYHDEPLLAVMPGVALADLWQVVGVVEKVLLAVSAMVVAVGLSGLMAALLAGLNERRRELAILRAVGARPLHVFCLLLVEGVSVSFLGVVTGIVFLWMLTLCASGWVQSHFGLHVSLYFLSQTELQWVGMVLAVSVVASLVPGWRAYRLSLADGLIPRI